MKIKKTLSLLVLAAAVSLVQAEINNTVDVSDGIYSVLENLSLRDLAGPLPSQKPYTRRFVLERIEDALSYGERLPREEAVFLESWRDEMSKGVEDSVKKLSLSRKTTDGPIHATFNSAMGFELSASGGLYTKDQFNQAGFDFICRFNFFGDLTEKLSYRLLGYLDLTKMPLYSQTGTDYIVGYKNWYDTATETAGGIDVVYHPVQKWETGAKREDGTDYLQPEKRTVKAMLNTSYLPYQYRRLWDGQMYYLSNLTASGLEGWPQQVGVSGGIQAEIHYSAFNGGLEIGAGRYRRSIASMDEGSSLVLNEAARPFLGLDLAFNLFDWLQYSFITGGLEYPNQDYMNTGAYNQQTTVLDDAYFFQNAYTVNMVELNFRNFHFDFGSSAVWPKRFEPGYLFPLANYVEYQNHIGDGDNLALFSDVKFTKPGVGSIWASIYLDELSFGTDFLTDTRIMYAGQLGVKALLPFIPFGTISARYTKIEPYCYTHQSINYTPWYSHYVWENYTNNGESLGYYTPPNSDEFFIRIEAKPRSFMEAAFQYQFIRHGADYGSQQVPGSSLYSELSPWNRENLHKYFLHDGAYSWQHIVSLSGKISLKNLKVPVQFFGTLGFLYSYYTVIDGALYEGFYNPYSSSYQTSDIKNSVYVPADSVEYPVQCGGILTLGIKIFNW